ncbi:MAG: efflux RND transporter periplasmic adaptor subunit, partial [Acidobacteria bacterium]|nr:efflux RND transporter periplasmic adaptor subunit [Acidobacteriota bacterium]
MWVVVGTLLVALSLPVGGTATGQEPEGQAVSVAVVKPVPGTEGRTVTLVGHVKPWQQAILYSKVAGYLDWIGVDKGSWVKKGELLAMIDDPETRLELERQSAEYDAKKIMYERLQAARAKNADMVSQFEIDRAKGASEAAQAAWERLRRLVAYAEIRAPYAGVITDRWVDPGALIQIAVSSQNPTARIVRIMSFDTVRVAVEIPEPDCPYIEVDLPASVALPESSGETLTGHLARFAWAIDPTTRTMPGEIDVPNADRRLRPG